MIQSVINWLQRAKTARRRIFTFRANGKTQYRDPVTVSNLLDETEPAWESMLGHIAAPIPGILDAENRAIAEKRKRESAQRLVEVGRKVFGLEPIGPDGRGTTEAEVVGVLAKYVRFMTELAAAAAPFGSRATSQPRT